ncbi:alpha/beta fold hydrolase [Ampullimonas aquatilis]|uniref:alpha/beta fold hydrolase n=1 Tax=Ampullimonas aquatilis TaxID=1341549 RepID=UPI003C788205
MKAFWFRGGTPNSRLLGIYHPPVNRQSERGAVLICPPWGTEQLRSHSVLRRLALQLSEAGFHVLRFDYHATGDSSGAGGEADASTWALDTLSAAKKLRELSNGLPMSIVGLRLGALIAARAVQLAEDNLRFHQLYLWDAPISGSTYLADLDDLHQRMLNALIEFGASVDDKARTNERMGFHVNDMLRQSLEALDLAIMAPAIASRLIERQYWVNSSEHNQVERTAATLLQSGKPIVYQVVNDDGHWDALSRFDVTLQTHALPQWIIKNLTDYVQKLPRQADFGFVVADSEQVETPSGEVPEEIRQFGSQGQFFGILTLPSAEAPKLDSPDIILLNAGLINRLGPYRTNVILARTLARKGYRVMRIDLSGIGDSPPRRERGTEKERAIADVEDAMKDLTDRHGATKFVLVGLCSGADLAQSVALVEPRVVGIMLIDPLGYRTTGFYLRYYLSRFLLPRYQLRFIKVRGKRILARMGLGQDSKHNETSDHDSIANFFRTFPPAKQIDRELLDLADRGMKGLFIYTRGVDYYYNYLRQFWDMFPSLRGRAAYEVILNRDSDHTTTLSTPRRQLIDQLSQWLIKHFSGANK